MYPKHYFEMFRPNIVENLVFVGMSFAPGDEYRWQTIIEPGITSAGLQCYRVDARQVSDSVLVDILQGINNAKVLVFDISIDPGGIRSGNVMYELGLSHATRLPEEVIVLKSDEQPLLFDMANLRVHSYRTDNPEHASRRISGLVREATAGIDSTKALIIRKTVSMLDEVSLGMIRSQIGFEYFSLQRLDAAFETQTNELRSAIRRMLDLGLISLEFRREQQTYAYYWTSVGRAVAAYLGLGGKGDLG